MYFCQKFDFTVFSVITIGEFPAQFPNLLSRFYDLEMSSFEVLHHILVKMYGRKKAHFASPSRTIQTKMKESVFRYGTAKNIWNVWVEEANKFM